PQFTTNEPRPCLPTTTASSTSTQKSTTSPTTTSGRFQNPPLLLIHGWPGFYYEWHLNIGPLSEHFDVVVPDMRGYAYTEKPDLQPEEEYRPADFAQDIRVLFDHLGWEKANIVSHDFGAVWVQQ